jgi:hypothetical protein
VGNRREVKDRNLQVLKSLKQQWCDLKKGRPGHRFQDRYERNKEGRSDESVLRRWIQPVAGVVIFVAGVFFCIFPGPGLPLLLAGAMLLAERSRVMARALDCSELKVRSIIRLAKEWWREASLIARNAVLVFGALVVAGAGYGAWQFFFGH